MPSAVLVRGGPRLYFARPNVPLVTVELGNSPEEAASIVAHGFAGGLPTQIHPLLREARPLTAADPDLLRGCTDAGLVAQLEDFSRLRVTYAALPPIDPEIERRFLLALAHEVVARELSSPEEAMIALARELERLQRAVRREEEAAGAFLTPATGPLQDFTTDWRAFRGQFADHETRLVDRVEALALEVVPNLAAVVGPSVAAQFVAQAGGVTALARLSASRLQLLGSRRRPGPGRGPRFGLLYRAVLKAGVPPDREGAYARSLAALAAIAVRADWSTHRSIGPSLIARRDRRLQQLRRRR